jgi:Methyltransferase domain
MLALSFGAIRQTVRRWKILKPLHAFRMRKSGRSQFIRLEYPVFPKVRVDNQVVRQLIDRGRDRYRELLVQIATLTPHFVKIENSTTNSSEPYWNNGFIPPLDAIAIYGLLAIRNPRFFVEIGSGNSTKFARRAIRDHKLRTRIISIDPHPLTEIDGICDRVIRQPLQDIDLALFDDLTAEDIVFCDGSHRAFQNSDVTVFLCEVMPRLATGMTVGVHDIFLPEDYPAPWLGRFYNEQYLLACYLLGGDALSIELPGRYCTRDSELYGLLDDLWTHLSLPDIPYYGSAFWFRINHRP